MGIRVKTVIVLVLLTILGLGPIPLTSVIGIYIVIFRPAWFKNLIAEIYDEPKFSRKPEKTESND